MEGMGDVILIMVCPAACNQLKMLHVVAALYLVYFKITYQNTKQLRGTKNKEHRRKCCV